MRLSDLLSETFLSLTGNKARSGLTILGIVVGIASVIALLGIGGGSQASVTERIESQGTNLLTVRPSSPGQERGGPRMAPGSVESLTRDDAEALAQLELVEAVAPQSSGSEQLITPQGDNVNASVVGVTESYAEVNALELVSGNFITDRDDASLAKVAVIGSQTSEDLFGEGVDPVGDRVRVGNMMVTVVGLLEEKGASMQANVDSAVLIPLSTHQSLLSGSEYLSSIQISVVDREQMDAAETQVTELLLAEHGIADESLADFRVQNMADLLETVTEVTGVFTALLAAVASISLVVGGIGIMNMMLTTVTERTREIGLRKALGADESAISAQFLAESVALTLTGGAVGIVVGWAVATFGAPLVGVEAVVSVRAIVLAVSVSAVIGIVFGFYPARRAARMSPIEALRYQ